MNPSRAAAPSRIELLELEIDVQLAELWQEAETVTDWNLETVAAYMRAAYGKGYVDALYEQERGALAERHGFYVRPRPVAR